MYDIYTKTRSDYVDVDDFLKNLAVMAVTVHHDSPLGNNYNNWFLATTPDLNNNRKYRMVQVCMYVYTTDA